MEQGNEMLPEAEALLVKAWTEENVCHEGRFWNVAFPELRPRPFQQPHPPLVRACISEPSVAAMAKIGRPVLIGVQTVETLRHRLQLYRHTMLESGFSAAEVETALDQNWAQRGLYVSENDAEALETADLALKRYRAHLLAARQKYNPGGEPPRQPGQAPTAAEVVAHAFLAGSPQRVAEQIAELREAGVRNLLLNVNVGQISPEKVERSMRLFGDKVLPMAPS
jgi:alkanesulfonate monooxygenase SsuD/methylene tetrahydromethanopterin reductase-like flavin-dependent oxidoreductase (luciferase family)